MTKSNGLLVAAAAFLRARWRLRSLTSRAKIDRFQSRRLAALRDHLVAETPFYAGNADQPFDQFPLIDKAILTANFDSMNRAGLSAADVRTALTNGEDMIGDHIIGHSTGTSGNRGYYVITEAERFVWLGTLLAKALPDVWWRRHRVALIMPGFVRLYQSAGSAGCVELLFFNLSDGIDKWIDAFVDFKANIIVAPPKVLRALAERGQLRATHIFSGAEVLDDLDAQVITQATGRTVRQIYMATEGLFGVSCTRGTLHLTEDCVKFEWEAAGEGSILQKPIVTDFTRRAQALVRYRMNDLLELSDAPCPCGSAFQAVRRIEGRADDCFELRGQGGELRLVTPDVMRNTVIDVDPAILDYRIVQTGPNAVTVELDSAIDAQIDARVQAALVQRFRAMGLDVTVTVVRGLSVPFDRKLRRVRREWRA